MIPDAKLRYTPEEIKAIMDGKVDMESAAELTKQQLETFARALLPLMERYSTN